MLRNLTAFLLLAASSVLAADKPVRVLVWDEQQPEQRKGYKGGHLGDAIAAYLGQQAGVTVKSVNLGDADQGLSTEALDATDVIVWWGHVKHDRVEAKRVQAVVERVKAGKLGLIALHSAHFARPFMELMNERAKADALLVVPAAERAMAKFEFIPPKPGYIPKPDDPLTPSVEKVGDVWKLKLPVCVFPSWRADGKPSHVRTLLPNHPIAAGLPKSWDIPQTEMYSDPFHVPKPDAIVFEEKWDLGESFRSGCVWKVGTGGVFYFRPGHETYPVYLQDENLRVILNAAQWLGTKPFAK